MKEMNLKEVQTVSLDVLKEFHRFCIENNLRYTLAYGTLIGAIRHKGFIPWDDDIDVMMPRPDYNRFVEAYQDNDSYICLAPEKKNSYLAYARLADIKSTRIVPGAPWSNKKTGIWIDIFPIDGVEADIESFMKTVKNNYSVWKKTIYARQAMGELSTHKSLMWNLKRFTKKILFYNKLPQYLNTIIQLCHRYNYDDCFYVSNLTHLLYASRSYFKKDIFEEYIEIPFEDSAFKCIKDYHTILTMIYGDYMQLPPVEKRLGHTYHNFYWVDM